eukprot:CAMPEP_0177450788 /NCGR_PEP_ID=MMETSP0369-20130122/9420_1 /TAXON_ID=447022 ORGANISM="Scrippsiella hangoei-like, Strain SHHI-4" /NCGR_SAMPLE_ID=MMETSP0369 /ASSEMBLY_ACC=CAM_ASM_000364 /LENGTH=176 /DNA_ID=CAMNT_0018923335 /DNA_START=34 /DNA_END=565 /DNA_ORIENTATION=+
MYAGIAVATSSDLVSKIHHELHIHAWLLGGKHRQGQWGFESWKARLQVRLPSVQRRLAFPGRHVDSDEQAAQRDALFLNRGLTRVVADRAQAAAHAVDFHLQDHAMVEPIAKCVIGHAAKDASANFHAKPTELEVAERKSTAAPSRKTMANAYQQVPQKPFAQPWPDSTLGSPVNL